MENWMLCPNEIHLCDRPRSNALLHLNSNKEESFLEATRRWGGVEGVGEAPIKSTVK